MESRDALHGGEHGGRTAEKNLGLVVVEGLGELGLDEVLGDEAGALRPAGGRVVEDVVDLETTVRL